MSSLDQIETDLNATIHGNDGLAGAAAMSAMVSLALFVARQLERIADSLEAHVPKEVFIDNTISVQGTLDL